jgi:Tol biopolymer transport system component
MQGMRKLWRWLVAGGSLAMVVSGAAAPSTAATTTAEGIVFVSNRGGNDDVYLMDVDGGNVRQLTDDATAEHGATISPDGTKVAYERAGEIFVKSLVETAPAPATQVTSTSEAEGRPAWSPDGSRLAFGRRYVTKRATDWDIVIRDIASGTETRVAHAGDDVDPDWSASGKIVFSSSASGRNLWTMAGDGTQLAQLTFFKAPATEPVWSPTDPSKIAYTQWYSGAPGLAITVLDVATGTTTRITPGNQDDKASWSPNGTTVVYTHYDRKGAALYTVPADGSAAPAIIAGQQGASYGPDWGAVVTSAPDPSTCLVDPICV